MTIRLKHPRILSRHRAARPGQDLIRWVPVTRPDTWYGPPAPPGGCYARTFPGRNLPDGVS